MDHCSLSSLPFFEFLPRYWKEEETRGIKMRLNNLQNRRLSKFRIKKLQSVCVCVCVCRGREKYKRTIWAFLVAPRTPKSSTITARRGTLSRIGDTLPLSRYAVMN